MLVRFCQYEEEPWLPFGSTTFRGSLLHTHILFLNCAVPLRADCQEGKNPLLHIATVGLMHGMNLLLTWQTSLADAASSACNSLLHRLETLRRSRACTAVQKLLLSAGSLRAIPTHTHAARGLAACTA
jgi:hypothetical protein